MLEKQLVTRRKFLSHAIDHVFGHKVIKDRACADLYANLLGEESNNKLIMLIRIKNPKTLSRIKFDWSASDENVFSVFQNYLPSITQSQIYLLDELSKPSWAAADELWSKRLINLLKHVEDLSQLRNYSPYGELYDEIAYLLISLADGQLYNRRAQNRFLVICSILMHLKREEKISAIQWADIAALYQTENYNRLLVKIDIGQISNQITDKGATREIRRYAHTDTSLLVNQSTAIPEFNQLFGDLGVKDFSKLSIDVEQLLFG